MSSVSASLPSVASLPSLPPFAHSKLTALPAVDMEHDRLARACGQGPVFALGGDFASSSRSQGPGSDESHAVGSSSRPAESLQVRHAVPPAPLDLEDPVFSVPFALAWGLRPRATSVRVSQRHLGSASHHPSRPRSASQPASIPVFAPSSPCAVLRSLRDVLDLQGVQMEDCLDVQRVCERWQAEGERDRGLARGEAVRHPNHHKTFGSSVAAAVRCASMSTVLGGYQHDVPWVVYACVEELNRTGIYQPGLFRAVPNRPRLARLIEAFDLPLLAYPSAFDEVDLCPKMTTPTPSTTRASLRKESMPDICALLKTYLDLLPEPLLDANLAAALHQFCVQPCQARENEMDDEGSDSDGGYFASHNRARSAPPSSSSHMSHDVPMTPSEHRHAQLSLEAPQILLAQHILRLAPPASLALLAYLLGFFTQLPLCPDNGMDFADVARMFGRVLVGGPAADLAMVRECVGWLLERWGRVSDGLFDVAPETAEEQSHSEPVSATKEAFTSPVLSPPLSSADTTPRQVQGDREADGLVRMQVPYDPGLAVDLDLSLGLRGGARPHSTSVSSDSSSSTTSTSVDTDDDGAFTFHREYVSCPSSPRRYFASSVASQSPLTASSPPASVRSLDVESAASWPSSECSTSRCSPEPTPFHLTPRSPYACSRAHSSEPEYGPYVKANETTPRNSAHFTSFEA
ncbi:Rho GTPase activation protein [Trametes sanguinea]|nr:Rho GTPase activation protein [Trametes sanguinea]